MAVARITQHFSDDVDLMVEVEVDECFPDAVAECVARVLDLWRGAVPDDET